MKTLLLLIAFVGSLTVSTFSQFDKSTKKQALKYIRNHDPEGYDILKAYYDTPVKFEFEQMVVEIDAHVDYAIYIDSSAHNRFLASLNTVVHEITHAYTHHTVFSHLKDVEHDFQWNNQYSLFYFDKDDQVLIAHTPTFPSSKIHGILPDSLRSSRYTTYIYPSAPITTQTIGVYGLLDEWHAYYHGTKNSVNFQSYFKGYARSDHERWVDYFTMVHGTYLAYPEFKLYILQYLLEAEKTEPEIFKEIMENEDFKYGFTRIDTLFGNLVCDFKEQKKLILQELMMKGVNCGEDDEFVFMGTLGYSNFGYIYQRLEKALTDPEYQRMLKRLNE